MQTLDLKGTGLSLQQTRIWLMQQKNLTQDSCCAIRLQGPLDVQAFYATLCQVINRHEILRTVFYPVPGMELPIQVVLEHVEISCPVIDLEYLAADSEQQRRLATAFTAFEQEPFDVQRGPLFQTLLLRMAQDHAVLLLRLSTLCADATTLQLMIGELAALYADHAQGIALDEEEPLQYADVSAWQEELLQEEEAQQFQAAWQDIDLSSLALSRLPFEREEPEATAQVVRQHVYVPLEPELQHLLVQVAHRFSVSLEALLLSCWQTLLWRLSDVPPVLGLSCDGRPYEELSSALGLYSRVVPLSVSLTGTLSFQHLLALVEAALQEARAHTLYFRWPSASQEANEMPAFFPLSFEFASWPAAFAAGPLRWSLLHCAGFSEPFTLKLSAMQVEQTLQLELQVDTAQLALPLVQQMGELLPGWLERLCRYPQGSLSSFSLLSEREQEHVLQWSIAPRQPFEPLLLQEHVAAWAQRTPEALAVVCGAEQMSYRQLNGRANQLAHLLRESGVGVNTVVALCLPRCLDQVVALLAVLKAGGAYAPLDPELPAARLCWCLSDLNAHLLLTQQGLQARFAAWSGAIWCLDQNQEEVASQSEAELQVRQWAQALASVIYTSGSTGQPKGVLVRHEGISNYTQALCAQLGVEAGWHFGTVSTLAADLGNTSIFGALASGGCVHLLPYETLTAGEAFESYMQTHRLDVLKMVPSHLSALLSQGLRRLPERYLLLGGERLPIQLLQRLEEIGSDCCIMNHYGPTETTIGVLTNALGAAKKAVERRGQVKLGRPIANVRTYILDRYQHLLPIGVVGELYIGGAGVARGYQGRAEQTGERFVPDRWSGQRGERMYKTGDLVRMGEDGEIEFVGRRDSQVKLRGYRIELGEVEATLERHANVRESVVVLHEGDSKEQLVAYYVAKQQPAPTSAALREFLEAQLPSYMVPTAFIGLRTLPLTANGKVDRRQLPLPTQHEELRSATYAPPRGPVEEILVGIWEDILKVKPIGIHDNFFSLGGHSLLATQVISRLRTVLRIELPIAHLFTAPTIAGLAEYVERLLYSQRKVGVPPLVPVSREQGLPLSFAQQRLWFLSQLEPDNTAYNKPINLKIAGTLHISALESGLNGTVRRHESLRTAFRIKEKQPVQIITTPSALYFPLVDLSMLDAGTREMVVQQLSWQEAARPFDLTAGSLLRALLLRLHKQEHRLLLTIHHITSDAWSNGILIHDVADLYNASIDGKTVHLPALPIQYADFAVWQRQWLQGEVMEAQLDYWREQLAGLTPCDLPTDHPRPHVLTSQGARLDLLLPPTLCNDLRTLSQREGVTLFMTLLAAFQVLLARYSGQSDIAVGTPIANRTRSELEGLIGFFVNTLVLRTDLSGNPSFLDLLQRVRETCLSAYAHQDIPFEKLVEVLQPERDLSRSPLFQVMLNLQQSSPSTQEYGLVDLTLKNLPAENVATKFDLTLSLTDSPQGLWCEMEYSTDLFAATTISRLLAHWQILLQAIVERPQAPLASFSLVGEEEQRMVRQWGSRQIEYPVLACIHERVEAWALTTPDAIALVWQGQQLSYRVLNALANQLAHALRTQGVGPECLVGVCLERSALMLIGLLSILKVGGAYVPLDPTAPGERLAFILTDAAIDVVLTQESLCAHDAFQQPSLRVLCLEELLREAGRQETQNLDIPTAVQQAAYVIYTSGSTGRPKGVVVSHANVGRLFAATISTLELGPSDVWSFFHSYAFDFSVWEVWGAWFSGGRVWVVSYEVSRAPESFVRQVEQEAVTVLSQTPSAFRQFMWAEQRADPGVELALRKVIFGGEALVATSLQEWVQRHGVEKPALVNMYGITETTVHVTAHRLAAQEVLGGMGSVIGRALADLDLYVLDEQGQLVSVGEVGQIVVGGAGLARGYLKRADLTAERFVPHPWSKLPGERLYQTGDLARWRESGELEYVGRRDEQVKLRGFRIELGEIESVLRQHAGVRACAVVLREEASGDKRLVAYVVGQGGGELSTSELRAFLQRQVPEYMVPSFFVELATLPLTHNGKLDRRALPEPVIQKEGHDEGESRRDAQSPIEEIIAGVWKDVLGLEQVDWEDNFFALGGHSLLVTQLVAQVRTILGVEVSLRSLFEAPTIAGMCEQVERVLRDRQEEETPPLLPVSRTEVIPLSFAQQRLWFLDQMEPGLSVYNLPAAVRLRGRLDERALEKSLDALIRRHESLRTAFKLRDEQPEQVIMMAAGASLPLVDLRPLGSEQREAELSRLTEQEAQLPFDLARGSLLRSVLLWVGEDEHILLLTMHHIASDGHSMHVLLREVAKLYNAFVEGKSAPLPALPIQYADFALWQRQWLQGEVLAKQLLYWKERLTNLSPLDLPTDHPRPAQQTFQGAHQRLLLPAALCEELKQLSQREGVTLFMTLLAAFQVLLARYSGQSDIAVGTPIANRTHAEMEGLIGFFVNTLVLCSDLSDNPSFQTLLSHVRETCLGAYMHQDVPFEKLVEALHPQRDLSRSPLFQVMLNLQQSTQVASLPTLQGLTLDSLPVESATTKFDLTLSLTESAQGLQCVLEYTTDLFEASTIQQLLQHWSVLLEGIVANPQQSVATLPLLSEDECQRLLVDWNATQMDLPDQLCLHRLFETQVEQTPDCVAVAFAEMFLTYSALNRCANQLAHALRTIQVGPEVPVGIFLPRSPEAIIAIMAALKAGGAYLPLDPNHPQERLAFIFEETHLSAIVTFNHLLSTLPAHHAQVICLDTDWETIAAQRSSNLSQDFSPDTLAAIIYTSGSTGRPKGVLVSHRNIVHSTSARLSFYPEPVSRYLLLSPLTFDSSVAGLFWTLSQGGMLALPQEQLQDDLHQLAALITRLQISHLLCVPSLYALLLEEASADDLSSLRTVIVAGESCRTSLSRLHHALLPHTSFYNEYGPTEGTVWSSVYHDQAHHVEAVQVPIGCPIPNVQLYLLDSARQPVPSGVAGELYIGGAGLTRGYHRRAALTAETFVPNPFSTQFGQRLYRTGDLARFLPEGTIEFLGRVDQQVKVRGYRIEPGEIEAALNALEGIEESAVVAQEGTAGNNQLVAYIVGKSTESIPAASELRASLQKTLPAYMVPSFFVELAALPLTPHGKLDRRALPVSGWQRVADNEAFLAPRNAVERALAEVWAEVLHTARPIGLRDNFFDLGGDSILGLQIIARAHQHGLHLTIKQLFQYQTIEALSTVVGQQAQLVEAEQDLVRGAFPLTPIQHWFFAQPFGQPHHWNQARLLEVPSQLDMSLLENAICAWMKHHDALRLRFERQEAGWQQYSSELEEVVPFSHVDLSVMREQDQSPTVMAAIAQAHASLNIFTGPLLRVVFFDLGGRQASLLFIAIHHQAIDGVSWRILMEDLLTAYEQLQQGRPVHLPAKTSSFKQWAEHLLSYARSRPLQQELAYWLAEDRKQVCQFPLDFAARPECNSEASARQIAFSLSEQETRALLEEVVPAYHVQMNEVLLAALAHALIDWTAGSALLVDLEGHGRESLFADLDVSRTVGWFTSMFPLLLKLEGTCGVVEELNVVKEHYRALPNHGIGYGILRYLSGDAELEPRWQSFPQAQVVLNYHGQFDQALAPSDLFRPTYLSAGQAHHPLGLRSHLLSVTGSISRGRLRIIWEYSEHFHRASTIEGLMNTLVGALRELMLQAHSAQNENYRSADFSDMELDQQQLEQIATEMDLG